MASRFWVGGTGTWDGSSTTHWSATTGGSNGASVPGSADTVTFDGSSGGGTVTVNTTVAVTSITCGAFTGTLDFSANNNNVTLTAATGFNNSGSGTRTVNLGNGTWTIKSTGGIGWTMATTTGLTFSGASATVVFNNGNSNSIFNPNFGSGETYGTLTINNTNPSGQYNLGASSWTVGTLNVTGACSLNFTSGNLTVSTAININGTVNKPILLTGASGVGMSFPASGVSVTGAGFFNFTNIGTTFTATNSYNFGGNTGTSGFTITPPVTGINNRSLIINRGTPY